jgi:hypothetical protein
MKNHFGQPSQVKEYQTRESAAISDSINYSQSTAEYSSWGLFYSQLYRLKLDFIQSMRFVKLGGRSEAIHSFYNCLSNCDDLLTMLTGIIPKTDIEQIDNDIETLEIEFEEFVRKSKLTHLKISRKHMNKLKMIYRNINFLMQRHNLGLPVNQNTSIDLTAAIVGD